MCIIWLFAISDQISRDFSTVRFPSNPCYFIPISMFDANPRPRCQHCTPVPSLATTTIFLTYRRRFRRNWSSASTDAAQTVPRMPTTEAESCLKMQWFHRTGNVSLCKAPQITFPVISPRYWHINYLESPNSIYTMKSPSNVDTQPISSTPCRNMLH